MIGSAAETIARETPVGEVVAPARFRRMVVWGWVGASGAVVDVIAVTLALFETGLIAANVVGWLIAVGWNFSLNYLVAWQRPEGSVALMLVQYLSVDIGRFGFRAVVVLVLAQHLGVPGVPATVLGIIAAAVVGFAAHDRLVFRPDA